MYSGWQFGRGPWGITDLEIIRFHLKGENSLMSRVMIRWRVGVNSTVTVHARSVLWSVASCHSWRLEAFVWRLSCQFLLYQVLLYHTGYPCCHTVSVDKSPRTHALSFWFTGPFLCFLLDSPSHQRNTPSGIFTVVPVKLVKNICGQLKNLHKNGLSRHNFWMIAAYFCKWSMCHTSSSHSGVTELCIA